MVRIGWREGYRLMRHVEAGRLASAFMATVWVLRGDMIDAELKDRLNS